jgi:hypothetical protein
MDTVTEILEAMGQKDQAVIRKRLNAPEVLLSELVCVLLNTNSVSEAALVLDRTSASLEAWLRRNKSEYFPKKISQDHWKTHLYSLIGKKYCPECTSAKPFALFYKNPSQSGGLTAVCSACQNMLESARQQLPEFRKSKLARTVKYQINKAQAVPTWADVHKIKEIYKNCPEGMHVDHIIPLQGRTVCGLHVETNLQYLSAKDNLIKSNSHIQE